MVATATIYQNNIYKSEPTQYTSGNFTELEWRGAQRDCTHLSWTSWQSKY